MGRTFARQISQIRNSDTYDDTLASGANLETNPTEIEEDLNGLRSQMKRAIWDDGAGNWYDDIPTVNAKKRAINDLNTDLDTVEVKTFLFPSQILTDISVPGGQAYVVLSVAGSEAPTQTAAVGAVTTEGAVVAYNSTFGTATLDEVSGPTALSPVNLCLIRDATTKEPIISSNGYEIYGLLQSESNVNGHTFDDTTNRVQISFVEQSAAGDDLVQTATADIGGSTVNYEYVRRLEYLNIPESAFLYRVFLDQAAGTDVTRQGAYDNQGATPVDVTTNSVLDLEGAGLTWSIRDDAEQVLLQVTEGSAGGTSEITIGPDVDLYDNNAVDVDFLQGAKFDTGGTRIDIGMTAGTIETQAGNDLTILGAQELFFDDGNRSGSTWSAAIKLAETTAEWDAFETTFGGEVSLMNAIVSAATTGARGTKTYAEVTAAVTAGNDVGGVGGGTNLDAQIPDMSSGTFTTDYDLYLNGLIQEGGADASANNDYYPGTSLANGQVIFEFDLEIGDKICVIPWA